MLRRTPDFWREYVLPRITGDFGQCYRYLNAPYPDGPNIYLERIERNIARVRRQLQSAG